MPDSFEQLRAAGFSEEEILADAGFSPEEIAGSRALPPMGTEDKLAAVAGQLGNFATLGYGDEIAAKLRSALGGGTYEEELSGINSRMDRYAAEFPKTSTMLNITGAIPLATATGGKAVQNPSLIGSVLRGAGFGGAFGAIQGSGDADPGERVRGAFTGGATGTVVGGGLGAAGHALISALTSRPVVNTINSIKDYSSAMRSVDDAGAIGGNLAARGNISPEEIATLIKNSGENDYVDVGLRGLYPEEKIGPLRRSFDWIDGYPTDRQLSGTSAVDIGNFDPSESVEELAQQIAQNLPEALKKVSKYGSTRTGLVLGKKNIDEAIGDAGEAVLQDAELIHSWHRGLAGERGSLGGGGHIYPSTQIPKEYALVADRMKYLPEEDLLKGRELIRQAGADDSPMWLPESVNSRGLDRLVRGLAQRDTTMDAVGARIDARKLGAPERVSGILDDISEQSDELLGGTDLQVAIGDVKTELLKARADEAAPFFAKARQETPLFPAELTKPKVVQQAIREVRKYYNEFDDLPDEHYDVLDKARQWLYQQKDVAANSAEKRFVNEAYKKLRNGMAGADKSYEQGLRVFANESTPIDTLFGDTATAASVRAVADVQPENAPARLLGLDPGRIEKLKDVLGEERGKKLVDAARAGLQGKVDSVADGRNVVSKIIDVPKTRKAIKAIIGDDEQYEKLMAALGRENTYAKAANKYNPGSTTAGNLDEAAKLNDQFNAVTKFVRRPASATAEAVMNALDRRGISPEMAQKLVDVLTDTGKGVDFYDKTLPFMTGAGRVWRNTSPAIKSGGRIGALESSSALSRDKR